VPGGLGRQPRSPRTRLRRLPSFMKPGERGVAPVAKPRRTALSAIFSKLKGISALKCTPGYRNERCRWEIDPWQRNHAVSLMVAASLLAMVVPVCRRLLRSLEASARRLRAWAVAGPVPALRRSAAAALVLARKIPAAPIPTRPASPVSAIERAVWSSARPVVNRAPLGLVRAAPDRFSRGIARRFQCRSATP
jgi:hypothetical protein